MLNVITNPFDMHIETSNVGLKPERCATSSCLLYISFTYVTYKRVNVCEQAYSFLFSKTRRLGVSHSTEQSCSASFQ